MDSKITHTFDPATRELSEHAPYDRGAAFAERTFDRDGLVGLIDCARTVASDTSACREFAAGVVDVALLATTLYVVTEVA